MKWHDVVQDDRHRDEAEWGDTSMTRALQSPIRPRERILLFGPGGSGKSRAVMNIAEVVGGQVFIWDNDYSAERLLATEFTDLDETGRVTVRNADADEWPLHEQIAEWTVDAGVDDWLVIDSITPTWEAVRNWYLNRMTGDDPAEYMLELRAKSKDKSEYADKMGQIMNYDIINPQYSKLYTAILKWPGHTLLTAEQDEIGKQEGKDNRALYGTYGVKPKGQKSLGHRSATTLWLTKKKVGEWYMTTVKDRGREEMEARELGNFAVDYLMAVAGWRRPKIQRMKGDDDE